MNNVHLNPSQIELLRTVPHFRDSHYESWDLQENLDFYTYRFVAPLPDSIKDGGTVADIGCGYGWLAISLALHTNCTVYAVEPNVPRLAAARQLAGVLGVEDRITWLAGSVGHIPLVDQSIDATFCVEVIEHISTQPEVVHDLARITRRHLTITTPNGALPIVFHDTSLPFCHWLPGRWRTRYAALFGRAHWNEGNHFWNPWKLRKALPDFRLESPLRNCVKPNLHLTFARTPTRGPVAAEPRVRFSPRRRCAGGRAGA